MVRISEKGGEYHKDDPDHVYWHVMINGAQSVLDDEVITDTPSPNQALDPESLGGLRHQR